MKYLLFLLFLSACGGSGVGVYQEVFPLPVPPSDTKCKDKEFVSYMYISKGVGGYACIVTAESGE